MKFIKSNYKILCIFLIISILFPITILTPSPIGIIPLQIGLTIVGYGGSILGGFLTLYGVWWTINDQNKQKREELSMQYRPILTTSLDPDLIEENNYGVIKYDSFINQGCVFLGNYDQEKYIFIDFFIFNIGNGETKFKIDEILVYEAENAEFLKEIELKERTYTLSPKYCLEFRLYVPFTQEDENIVFKYSIPLTINILITYNDLFDKKYKLYSGIDIFTELDDCDPTRIVFTSLKKAKITNRTSKE